MPVEARKRFRLVSALTWLAVAAPVVAGGYIVYQKYRALSDGGAIAATQARPQAPERVWIVANDDEQPMIQPARRPASDQDAAHPASAEVDPPAKKRVINLGPSARPEQRAAPAAAVPTPAPQAATGPRIYQFAPEMPAPAGPTDAHRRRGVVAESDPAQGSGSSLSVGPGQITSGSNP
jgi:hypothetical protein